MRCFSCMNKNTCGKYSIIKEVTTKHIDNVANSGINNDTGTVLITEYYVTCNDYEEEIFNDEGR